MSNEERAAADLTGHSLRIGRHNLLAHTAIGSRNPYLMCRVTNHASERSETPYAIHGTTTEDLLQMDRQAVTTVVRPVETVVRFDTAGQTGAVYLTRQQRASDRGGPRPR